MTAPRDIIAEVLGRWIGTSTDAATEQILDGLCPDGEMRVLDRTRRRQCEQCSGVGWIVQDQTIGWPYGEQVQCSCVDGFVDEPTLHRLERWPPFTFTPDDPRVSTPGQPLFMLAAVEAPVAPTAPRPVCERCKFWLDDKAIMHSPQGCYGYVMPAAAPVAPEPESERP